MIIAAAAVAGAAGAYAAQVREAQAQAQAQREQEAAQMTASNSYLSANLPAVPPMSDNPEEMLERAERMNRPEFLLQDPLNRRICRIIEHVIRRLDEEHAEAFEEEYGEENRARTRRANSRLCKIFVDTSPIVRNPIEYAPIPDIMAFFPSMEQDQAAARLRVLEDAGLIEYEWEGKSPMLWREDEYGFALSEEVRDYLTRQAQASEETVREAEEGDEHTTVS